MRFLVRAIVKPPQVDPYRSEPARDVAAEVRADTWHDALVFALQAATEAGPGEILRLSLSPLAG